MTDGHPVTLAFFGHGDGAAASRAGEYEDRVLALLPDHGARVLYRGRRAAGEPETLPLEVHLLWFPDRAAFDAYLGDPRRAALLAEFGEVFTAKHVVELDTLAPWRLS